MTLTKEALETMASEANIIIHDVFGLNVPKIKYEIGVAKRQAGLANWNKRTIRISKEVMRHRSKDECMNTVIHEILHILTPRSGHTGEWKVLANRFNKTQYSRKYGDITRCYKPTEGQIKERKENSRYSLKCTSCEKEFHYTKLSNAVKNPQNYRCKCKGRIERIK